MTPVQGKVHDQKKAQEIARAQAGAQAVAQAPVLGILARLALQVPRSQQEEPARRG